MQPQLIEGQPHQRKSSSKGIKRQVNFIALTDSSPGLKSSLEHDGTSGHVL